VHSRRARTHHNLLQQPIYSFSIIIFIKMTAKHKPKFLCFQFSSVLSNFYRIVKNFGAVLFAFKVLQK